MNKRSRISSPSDIRGQRAGHILDDDSRADFIYVGTALPSIQKHHQRQREQRRGWDDKPKEYSRDAFKGGFTAGYFGTVGSKEGWQPSKEFVSSRTNRAQRREMKPEDFMDAEDLADQQEAQVIGINSDFSNTVNRESEEQVDTNQMDNDAGEYTSVVGAMAERIAAEIGAISVSNQRLGDRIMSAMGWKPGHGIGPLLRDIGHYNARKVDKTALTLLPPQPTPLINPTPKADSHGVGYGVNINSLSASAEVASLSDHTLPKLGMLFKKGLARSANTHNITAKLPKKDGLKDDKKKKSKRSVDKLRLSFGTLDDDDDIDEYTAGKGNMNYAASDRNKGESHLKRLVSGLDVRSNVNATQKHTVLPALGTIKTHCNDGKLPLPGFILIHNDEPTGIQYAAPIVPAKFTGIHKSSISRWDSVPALGSESRIGASKDSSSLSNRLLTAADRARLGIMENPASSGYVQHPETSAHSYRTSATMQTQHKQSYTEQSASRQHETYIAQQTTEAEMPTETAHASQRPGQNVAILSRFVAASSSEDNITSTTDNEQDKSRIPTRKKIVARTLHNWKPSRLLCKRMGILQPPNAEIEQEPGTTSRNDGIQNKVQRMRAADFIQWRDRNQEVIPIVLANNNTQDQETDASKLNKRPEMALFESIFGTDD
ncbi:hypothetical protein H4S08_003416 [Coemansia sp. RSA 1365]|nr:hypothetical protein H4S08_003416 [Coemansia sp. RSA 1365]